MQLGCEAYSGVNWFMVQWDGNPNHSEGVFADSAGWNPLG